MTFMIVVSSNQAVMASDDIRPEKVLVDGEGKRMLFFT